MADYSIVSDRDGMTGLWIREKEKINQGMLGVLLSKHDAPTEWFERLTRGDYRVVTNKHDSAGGYFVMFRGKAPGE